MKITYLGFDILLSQSDFYSVGGTEESPNYKVESADGPIYLAASQAGNAYATSLDGAIDGAKQIIEAYLSNFTKTGEA